MMNCSSDEDKTSEGKRKAAWVDEDDNGLMVNLVHDGKLRKLRNSYAESTVLGDQYSRKLRTQFTNLSSIPTWASDEEKTLSDVESEDEHGGKDCLPISSLVAGSVLKKSHVLPGGILDIKQLKSCCLGKSAGGVSGIQFHPHANVLLATGTQRSAVIFQVDGEANPKLQSIDFENASLCMAKFSQDGKEILGVGSRQVFYVYDIGSGKVSRIDTKGHRGISSKFVISPDNKYIAFPAQNGYISLFSNKTRQWMFDLKMNGTVDDTAFSSGSQELLSIGSDGQIYVWDMRSRSCINKFTDQGCVHGTSLAVSSLDMYFACGSDSGVVNVYGMASMKQGSPQPLHEVMNLTTTVDHMCFNHNDEIIAMSSSEKKSAVRLMHLPSGSVFSNWPSMKTDLHYVTSMDFSASGGYLACGNAKGRVALFRLNQYEC